MHTEERRPVQTCMENIKDRGLKNKHSPIPIHPFSIPRVARDNVVGNQREKM